MQSENANYEYYCWRTLIIRDKFQVIYDKFIFAYANWECELHILLLKNSDYLR